MTQPTAITRFIGAPRTALVVLIGCAVVVACWYEESAPWWLALISGWLFLRTLAAIGAVKRYKTWRAKWDEMDAPQRPQEKLQPPLPSSLKVKRPKRARVVALQAIGFAAAALLILRYVHVVQWDEPSDGLALLWLLACAGFAWKLLQLPWVLLRRKRQATAATTPAASLAPERKGNERGKAMDAAVAWLLPRASSSPSRSDATRHLPEYSARALAASSAKPRG